VEPLKVIMNASNSRYDRKMSAYVLLKSDKMQLLKTNKTGCIVIIS